MNIARINTFAEAAYNAAKFAEIGFSGDAVTKTHIFATLAYQSYPYHANFLSISEAGSTDGVWDVDRTQSFQVTKEDLDGVYLQILGIRKKPVPVGDGTGDQLIEFTVFMAAQDHMYRAEFAVARHGGLTQKEFALRRADFHKTIEFNLNEALSRVAFQPIHHPLPSHEWPEFYLFVTGTRPLSPVEAAATGKKPRMPDALLLSENYLRTPVHGLELMQEDVADLLEAFTLNGSLAEGITYSDSRVLPSNSQRIQGSSRTTIFDDIMRFASSYELQVKTPSSFGNDWTANTEECALIDIDYDQLPSFGITEEELVSYMDVPQSSRSNMFDNEMVLVKNERSALQVYNNIEYLVE